MAALTQSTSTPAEMSLSLDAPDQLSKFEDVITRFPTITESLLSQLPTESVFALYHTSPYLNAFLRKSPTSWRYISWRLYQPALQVATPTNNGDHAGGNRQSSNYALDQLLLNVISPFSTRLVSLELDNTAVSGATLFQSVMIHRKETLEHVSVRGCKNVSLKYHINPWLMMHAMALDRPESSRAPGYEKLALKSLYTYRCRHHRRRPYLPSSLARKESDSEPTHELVLTCHKLGIWTDTAWCTTPGARCFRRRGYVTMRVPQDPREVWVVFDRLWRSRNWLGPVPEPRTPSNVASNPSPTPSNRRKRDVRIWEFEEEAMNGEAIGAAGDGKDTPTHLRETHQRFVQDIFCDNCSESILERCEQCSVMMHCSGCRKTLCASCAFDRPYLRNKTAPEEERNKIWWAPGCAVSPCSMQDQDLPPPGPAGNGPPSTQNNTLPSIKFKWCCTEPVFSGGGGITFGNGSNRDTDRIRAAPLKPGQGWEDPEFSHLHDGHEEDSASQIGLPLARSGTDIGPGGRWPTIDALFKPSSTMDNEPQGVPRILCDECHSSEQWKMKCRACSMALCLKHDVRERLKVRICGYKDLNVERAEFKQRQKALKLLSALMARRKKGKLSQDDEQRLTEKEATLRQIALNEPTSSFFMWNDKPGPAITSGTETPRASRATTLVGIMTSGDLANVLAQRDTGPSEPERPLSPGSNSSGPPSRASSPAPSTRSSPETPEPRATLLRPEPSGPRHPMWRGCQSFFCPSSRAPGDHRRRCIAIMRQCVDCKIHVCEQCVSNLEAPCPCKGCRAPPTEENSIDHHLRFFCPNCRWIRMKTGKCKRKPVISTNGKTHNRRRQKHKSKLRKPLDERTSHQTPSANALTPIDGMDGVSEFFQSIDIADTPGCVFRRNPLNSSASDALVTNVHADANPSNSNPEEIRQLEDMGQLARDLIRRIQALRQQFGPDSLAALALPNIRMEEPLIQLSMASRLNLPQAPLAADIDDANGHGHVGVVGFAHVSAHHPPVPIANTVHAVVGAAEVEDEVEAEAELDAHEGSSSGEGGDT